MPNTRTKLSLALLGAAILGAPLGAFSAAEALPGGAWASAKSPLPVNYAGWQPVGYSYGVWQGVREDKGRGTRLQDWSADKTRSTYDRGTYTRHTWFWNGSYCYLSSFSNAGVSAACQSGWHRGGSTNSGSNNSTAWKFWETWTSFDPKANSGRGQMQTCFNIKLAPDRCSTFSYLRGAKL